MRELIWELCKLPGVSGDEGRVRAWIINQIEGHCTWKVDPLGNLIAYKTGRNRAKNRVMLSAHMDEVGFIITDIAEDGRLRFAPVGGIDPRVVLGRRVYVGEKALPGVIAAKPVHQLTKEQKSEIPKIEDMRIDIGADSAEQAREHVQAGDCAVFHSDSTAFGDGFLVSKALDDRAGCALLIDLIRSPLAYDAVFVFSVQEEVGTRGAKVYPYHVQPDMAVVVETTTAADIAGVTGADRVCELGKGPVVSYMDRGAIYDRQLYRLAFDTAAEHGIPCQTKTMVAGGNDASSVHSAVGGVRTLAISMPCRYLHSPSCVLQESDIQNTRLLLEKMLEKMAVL